jgi:hypothetical protein
VRRIAMKLLVCALLATVLSLGVAPTVLSQHATPVVETAGSEVLLEATLPAAVLPDGAAVVEFWRSTFFPGDEHMFPAYSAVSVGGDVVLTGEYGARSEEEILAWDAGQEIATTKGEEVLLGPGGAVIYLDNAANQWVRNAGPDPTEVASFAITRGEGYEGPQNGVDGEGMGLSGHDVLLTIDRMTLAPGEALPAGSPDSRRPVLRIVEEGMLTWSVLSPDGAEEVGKVSFSPGDLVPFTIPADGKLIELRNDGEEPLVLLTLTVVAAETPAATPIS